MSDITPDRLRTQRRQQAVDDGLNPLTMTPAHPDAPTDTSPNDRYPRYGTCGTCTHLIAVLIGQRKRALKCNFGGTPKRLGPRVTLGPATDVRAWWPGCEQYDSDGRTEPPA